MKRFICFLTSSLLFILPGTTAFAQSARPEIESGYSQLSISPDGSLLAFSNDSAPGLYICNLASLTTRKVCSGIGPAYQVSWSADHKYLGFKYLIEKHEGYLQSAALVDLDTYALTVLSPFSMQCGVPSFTPDNKVVFTSGRELFITDIQGTIIRRYSIPAYANLTPVSPDGRFVLLNDAEDRLYRLTISDGRIEPIPLPEGGFFKPIWSPSGDGFICRKLSGELYLVTMPGMEFTVLGPGRNASWSADGSQIFYTRVTVRNESEVQSMQLIVRNRITGTESILTDFSAWSDYAVASPSGMTLIFSDRREGRLMLAERMEKHPNTILTKETAKAPKIQSYPDAVDGTDHPPQTVLSEAIYFDIPYLNQVYDPPSWFNGFWACGGTSAVMCLAYYGLLDQWPLGRWSPTYHIVDFSHYICEKYTYNGYTFNIGGRDPDGTFGYGAYGYIIQNDWRDTKGNMAGYAKKHGLESSVDWSPSRQKSLAESNKEMPYVLLNSLTTSGHYISVIGYENEATTLIVNDPYGNKNQGYYNYYGRRVKYDWPGYSNGYANLNTVHCFIYFRGELAGDLTSALMYVSTDTSEVSRHITLSGRIINRGAKSTPPSTSYICLSTAPEYRNGSFILDMLGTPELAIEDTFDIEKEIALPDSLASNSYYIGILADADSLIGEMLEDNNFSSARISVLGYPEISASYPGDHAAVDDPYTKIYATYRDILVGIDTSNIQLFLDGSDISGRCQKTLRKLTFIPREPLTEGQHSVRLVIPNKRGYQSTKAWSFSIDTGTKLDVSAPLVPGSVHLVQNYPNPFNGQTRIQFSLEGPGLINLAIFAVSGAEVITLADGYFEAGDYGILWDGKAGNTLPVSSGFYYYRLKTSNGVWVKRMLYLK